MDKKKPRGKPFEKGNKGGPGNPYIGIQEQFRADLIRRFSENDRSKWNEIIDDLLDIAKNAQFDNVKLAAIKQIFEYLLGKPQQGIELSGDVNTKIPLSALTDEEIDEALLREARRIEAKRAQARDASDPGAKPA